MGRLNDDDDIGASDKMVIGASDKSLSTFSN